MRASILILEPPGRDFRDLRRAFRAVAPAEWSVQLVCSGDELLDMIRGDGEEPILVIPDRLTDTESGLSLIARARQIVPQAPVVVVAEQGSVERASQAVAAGANDFLVLGEQLDRRIATLLKKLEGLLEAIDRNRLLDEHNAQLQQVLQSQLTIVGRSP
jgi:DNA-binding NtrC family response regulator